MTSSGEDHDEEEAPPSMQSAVTLAAPDALPAVRMTGTRKVAPTARYEFTKGLGEGGMGEVLLAEDAIIGRSVALKRLRQDLVSRADFRGRFVREAKVQGQLEHPSVVPVYELGVGSDGAPFFTMRRISGYGLDHVIELLGDGAPDAEREFSLRKRLQIFQQVCLGMAYAHSRGVVHRDLKPGNVMLGHFGEVYILDWGLALLTDERDPAGEQPTSRTRAGQVLGTPGYMSPEQATDAHGVDERADVYSLGTVLFELLALKPLHPGVSARELVRSTQVGADARVSVRVPDSGVPPELDAICVKATAFDPKQRYASAMAFHDAIDRFLDGRRDVEQRRRMAARHVKMALAAADRSGKEYRNEALREASQALALDPESKEAADIVVRLGLTAPAEVPREVRQALTMENADEGALAAKIGIGVFSSILPVPLYIALTGASPGLALTCSAALAVAIGLCIRGTIGVINHAPNVAMISVAVSVAIGCAGFLTTPIAIIPQLAVAAALAMHLPGLGRYRWVPLVSSCLAVIVPGVLDWTGTWGSTTTITPAGIRVAAPSLEHLSGVAIMLLHTIITVLALGGAAILLSRLDDNLRAKRRQLHYRLWVLGKLVPGGGRVTTTRRTAPVR